jgi:hypothetical protein
MISDAAIVALVTRLREAAEKAIADREYLSFTVHPVDMLALLATAEGQSLKSLPSIVRDDAADRIEAAVAHLEQVSIAQGIMVNK